VQEIVELLGAITDLAWFTLTATLLWAYRSELRRLLAHARKLEVGSEGVKLELDALREAAEDAAKQVPLLAAPAADEAPRVAGPAAAHRDESVHAHLPKYAVVLLAAEIEHAVREYLAVTGRLEGRRAIAIPHELARLELPKEVATAVHLFWEVRNRIVHGVEATDDDAVRAVDAGLSILATVRNLPRERNVVYHPGVELFHDSAGTTPIADAKGLVLECTSADGKRKSLRVFPTRRNDYVKGQEVAWEWSAKKIWESAWFRHPDTGALEYAWTQSMEFVGHPLAQR
jgi:hypothetical protein